MPNHAVLAFMTLAIRKEKSIKKANSFVTVGLSQTDRLACRGYLSAIRQIVYKILFTKI
jgi:hypothetical protein